MQPWPAGSPSRLTMQTHSVVSRCEVTDSGGRTDVQGDYCVCGVGVAGVLTWLHACVRVMLFCRDQRCWYDHGVVTCVKIGESHHQLSGL